MATLYVFFAIVTCEDLECNHFNIKNAFTKSKISDDHQLYIEVLKGVQGVKKGHKLHILCSLYSLKQSARDWNRLMNAMLLE